MDDLQSPSAPEAPETQTSKMTPADWENFTFSPPPEQYGPSGGPKGIFPERAHWVRVSDGHTLYAQEFGNPKGEPVIFLHGGPGGGCSTEYARLFDPDRYRVILFDQRGCGHSFPNIADNYRSGIESNDTDHLVEDINAVREAFGIHEGMRAHVIGGSWGTTLGLVYAIRYPQNVASLILRGVFLGHKEGIDFLWQGNAANYEPYPNITYDRDPKDPDAKLIYDEGFLDYYNSRPHREPGGYRAYMPGPSKGRAFDGQMPFRQDEYGNEIYRNPDMAKGHMLWHGINMSALFLRKIGKIWQKPIMIYLNARLIRKKPPPLKLKPIDC